MDYVLIVILMIAGQPQTIQIDAASETECTRMKGRLVLDTTQKYMKAFEEAQKKGSKALSPTVVYSHCLRRIK